VLLKRPIFSVLLIAFTFLGTAQVTKPKLTHLMALKSRPDFDLLKGEPLTNNFNGIECVKLVYVLATKELFYLESKRYRWHYRFTQEVLNDPDDLDEFNSVNYGTSSGRKYILATFNYNVNTKNYFLQFSVSDNPSDALIKELTDKVNSTFFKGKDFKLLLNSTILLRRKQTLSQKYAVLTADEIFRNQTYQSIFKGRTKGILKFIHADSLKQNKDYSNYIIILNGSSNELPVCKGIVTNEFQTPLSHICLLTNNRRSPAAASKKIFSVDSLKNLENKFVELIVGEEKMIIKRTAKITEDSGPKKLKKLSSDTLNTEIASVEELDMKKKNIYGSKVCGLAELKKLEKKGLIKTPGKAFGIPFFYYLDHIRSSDTYQAIRNLQAHPEMIKNDSLLDKELKKIRDGIKKAPLNKNFLAIVTAAAKLNFGEKKIRFRSSSNCEDEDNFNGAGLYTSATGMLHDTSKTIEKAIKKVWASLWTNRAFKEREFFGIDHSTVYMGILVHEAFDNEFVNGVAITKNLYRNYQFGFVINMQKGEEEVVSPKKGMVCEQVVSYMNNQYADFYNINRSADWISFSGLNNDGSLLSGDELFRLTKQLEAIKKHFYDLYRLSGKTDYKDFAMDVEFKLIEAEGKRQFLFKQARPYNQ
jgi:pyruvate, water dikinase